MIKVLTIFGTRPEAIKMAPLVMAMKGNKNFQSKICVTGQHKEMLDQVLNLFQIYPDYNLNVMKKNQSLNDITTTILEGLSPILIKFKPNIILVQGDTTTAFASSIAAFYQKIKIGHIESGLRTGDIYSPWPEEGNRRLISAIADYHFAPTSIAKNNLISENIDKSKILVTGNTVIDSLLWVKDKINKDEGLFKNLEKKFSYLNPLKNLILVTCHRRESFGEGLKKICFSLKEIASKNSDVEILLPVHPNPQVTETIKCELKEIDNIFLVKPQSYLSFCYLMDKAKIILTDSGGIQEEAPSLGKPVLVMRNTTERPEGISSGTVKLVGIKIKKIINETNSLLSNSKKYKQMSQAKNPYGDGKASKRILKFLVLREKK